MKIGVPTTSAEARAAGAEQPNGITPPSLPATPSATSTVLSAESHSPGASQPAAGAPPGVVSAEASIFTPREPTPAILAFLEEHNQRLEGKSPEEILRWAVETYYPRFTMATGLGPEGCVIISMLAKIEPRVYVFNLDTGYQFAETLALRERIAEKYGMVVDLQRPEMSVADYEAANSGPVYRSDSDRCCRDRKIRVLERVSVGFDAWATGIRRDQSPTRANTPIVRWDKKFGLVKISPLAAWTKKEVWGRILSEGVPYNPLHDQGYPSIGCWPCTRPVGASDDERAGRWAGTKKTECGLHT